MVDEFEEVCPVTDLGNEKLYHESGVVSLQYYYPDTAVSATFDTVTLSCVDGAVFTYLDVWEESTET